MQRSGGGGGGGDYTLTRNSGMEYRDDVENWDALKTSNVEDRLSESSDSRPSPDLHIPRLNE